MARVSSPRSLSSAGSPTLDEVARVAGIVSNLEAEDRTIVAISHDASFIAASFARVVRLEAGHVVADGPAAEAVA